MSNAQVRPIPDRNQGYLADLLAELRQKVTALEQKRVQTVQVSVTAVDPVGGTFTAAVPTQTDGSTTNLAGISAPTQFLPSVGDTVALQMIGPVPTYQPASIAPSAVTDREIARGTKVHVWKQPTQPTAVDVGDVWKDTSDGNKEYIWAPVGTIVRQNLALNPSFEANTPGVITSVSSWTGYRTVQDGVTAGSTTITSATANFVAGDIGATVTTADLPAGTTISSVTNSTTVVVNNAATGSHSGQTLVIESVAPMTTSIVTAAAQVANGTKAVKVQDNSMEAINGEAFGLRQSFAASPGDAFRISAVVSVSITDVNKNPELLVEWLNGSVLLGSDATVIGDGSLIAKQTLSYTGTALPPGTTTVRLTVRRRSNGTGSPLPNADIAIDSVLVEKNVIASTQTTYFDGNNPNSTDSKWDTPSLAPNTTSTYWQDSAPGTNTWYPVLIRNGGVQPGSLVASNIIASQTITASLLEALMVLTNIVIAGDPAGNHATMQSDGFHIFRLITGEGMVEVGRLAAGTSNFLTIVDNNGNATANIDDSGGASFIDLNVANSPVFQGHDLSDLLTAIPGGGGAGTALPGAQNWIGYDGTAVISTVTSETGIIEVEVTVEKNRIYWIVPSLWWTASNTATYLDMKVRDGGTSAPSITSPIIDQTFFSTGNNNAWSLLAERCRAQRFSTAGLHRLLLTVDAGGTGSVNVVQPSNTNSPTLQVVDLGPDRGNPSSVNRGGGGASPPTQQYYVDLAPGATATYQGGGSQRFDTTDIVQGWDPSGFNGDGSGWWVFSLPSITGTVDRVDFYCYTNHTYFNSGGQAIFRPIHTGPPNWPMSGLATNSPQVFTPYPNPGGKQITLPSSWWGGFSNAASPRTIGIAAGPAADIGGGTNETYYCRFDGPSARLRIWYTQ